MAAVTVLLVDDHAVLRDGLRAVLTGQPDIEVVAEAADGGKGVQQCREHAPNVAIVDLAMPVLDGVEVTRRMGEACPETRVVVLSMHGTSEHVYQALRAGAVGYLLKESAGRELVAAVRSAAIGRRYLCRPVRELVRLEEIDRRLSEGARRPLERLSQREREVFHLVVAGASSREIAERVHLSPKTVDTYRSRIMCKLGVDGLAELVRFAVEHGIAPPR